MHIDASLLVVGAMLAQNLIHKYDQPIIYASRLLSKAEHNYITTEKKLLTMVFALHKFKHFKIALTIKIGTNTYINLIT